MVILIFCEMMLSGVCDILVISRNADSIGLHHGVKLYPEFVEPRKGNWEAIITGLEARCFDFAIDCLFSDLGMAIGVRRRPDIGLVEELLSGSKRTHLRVCFLYSLSSLLQVTRGRTASAG